MSTRAAEALQEVQAAIAAWTEEPPVPASDILDVLASALDMLQSPHPWDGARRGSTLASGVDALRAWCQHAPPHIARLSDKRAFCTHPVWEICTTRIEGVFALPPSSALQRVRTLLDQLWTMWDQVDEVTAPSSWAKAWYQAHASLNQGVSLLVMDALLTHYGLAILEETPRCFFQRILADIQAGRGQVSRRSHLASTLIAATQHTDAWLTAWLPVLASSLSHTDERAADNVMAHVVHPLLDQWPSTLAPLLDALDERGDSYAIVAVLQAAKVRDLCTLDENAASNSLIVPLSLLEACLSSGSPRMHVAALALCVDAKTPAQPLHAHEIHIVRRFFAESLMMPSSVARKDSIAFFVKLLVRIRTSANKLSKDDARLRAMHGLLQHLYDAVVFAMHPGAPYPCMILATSLLLLLLEATSPISTVPMHMHRLHDAMRALHKAQKTFPAAALPPLIPTQPVILRLVHLATESTYDDIQGTAVLILMRLAQRPSSLLRDVSFLTDHVVLPSWTRLPAMKESDAYASVQLLQLYHKVCPEAHHKDVLSSLGVSHDASLSWTQNLIEVHTKRLTAYLTTTTSLAHASTHGLHGFLAALTYLVACEPPTVPQHLYNVILRVWAFVAPVLRAASDEGAEDVSELERASAATEHTSVSEMQQILSFSWRAIKEASALLCALALHCDPALLPWDDINETFLAWLLQIRHRGAFSTVYPHYQTMARARLVMSSSQPTDWLHALVSRVEAHADAFSTTRRSAGLGYAVMSLLSAHSGATLTQETKWVMQRFLALSHDAVPVRCIHALNIIRVLIMDSSMASAMKMYQADALTRAVACFSSPHWGVRNAAMMLYAAVSNRYFGIHAFQSLNGPTLDGLLDASPALAETLITALCEGSCHVAVSDLATVGHGSGLYAILLLLSQCRGHVSFQREDVLEALARCMASANTSVRTAAAHCYAALVPAEERSRVLAHRVEQSTTRDQNALAGTLALAHACAQLSVPCANVLQANWVWLTDNPCPVTVTGFLEALEACEAGAQASTWLHAFFQASCVPTSTMTLPRDPLVVWLLPVALRLAFAHKVALPMEAWSCSMDMATALIMFSIQEPEPVQAWSRVGWTDEGVRSTLLSILLDSAYPLDARIGAATLLDRMGGEYAAHIQAILTLAYATEHVPLREALLPLLGRAWDSDTLEACVYLWDACAKPDVPTASRLGVAQALSRVHTPTVSMALLTWRLLQDDDADVRAAACALFPPPHISSSRFSCVYAMHRGPQSCIDRLWATWADHPTFHQAVWDLWMPTTSVETKGVSKLFSGEAMNQFQDPVLDLLRAYDACANGRIPCPPHMTSLLTPETAGITEVPTSAEAYHAALQRVLLQQLAQRYASTTSSAWSDASIDKALALLGVPAWSIPKEPASQEASKPLRIALLSDFFFPNVGGVEGHMYMIGQQLLRRGHKVIVITHAYEPDRVGVRYLPGGMKVYYIPYGVIARQDTLPNFFALLPLLRSILLREQIDIVHAHQALSSMGHEGIFLAKCLGLKAVFTDHSLFGFSDVSAILTNKMLRFALTDVDHVVCVSHTGRENTVLRAHLAPDQVSTIPNAVDARNLYPDPARAPTARICIVVLSRLMYRKGIDLLLTAIPRICALHTDVCFVIGGDGPKYVELEQMRERCMLQDRVALVGAVRQRDVRAHLTQGHIFLNTSLTEAFGTSIIEATSAGLYVVTTKVGGIPELLPASMMTLADPCTEAIVDACSAAISRIRAGEHDPWAQHRIVTQMYSWEETTRRLEVVYKRAMAQPWRGYMERFARYRHVGGPIGGLIICLVVAAQMIIVTILEWVYPVAHIALVD